MKNSFKIVLLLIVLSGGFVSFRNFSGLKISSAENKISVEEKDIIDNKIKSETIANVLSKNVKDISYTSSSNNNQIDIINSLREDDLYLGNKDSKVIMIEYDSLTCPHCKDFYQNIFPDIKKNYIDTNKILYITRSFPFDGISFKFALMLDCLKLQSDKLKLRDLVFKNQNIIFDRLQNLNFKDQSDDNKKKNESEIKKVFEEFFSIFEIADLDRKFLEECGNPDVSKELSQAILDKTKLAYESKYKIEATPTFIINGKKYDGTQTLKYWKDILDSELSQVEQIDKVAKIDSNESSVVALESDNPKTVDLKDTQEKNPETHQGAKNDNEPNNDLDKKQEN